MMKLFTQRRVLVNVFLSALTISFAFTAHSQVRTAKSVKLNSQINGYYEYLPANYNTSDENYPVIIYFHGMGEAGNGSSELTKMLGAGIPKLINDGKFPETVTVNGKTFRFIIIAPQYIPATNQTDRMTANDIDDVLEYVIANYRIDKTRIYMTGLSAGGYNTWLYASSGSANALKLAAIVPICGDLWPSQPLANVIAKANLPVWATHNDNDPNVNSFLTSYWVGWINSPTGGIAAPVPRAKATIFANKAVHDAWTQTYDPAFKVDAMNVYEWMLQYSRPGNIVLPVNLTDFTARQDDQSVLLTWITSSEKDNSNFILERAVDGLNFSLIATLPGTNALQGSSYKLTDNNPLVGSNYYRLGQKDKDGKITYLKTVKILFVLKGNVVLKVLPNPASSIINLILNDHETGTFQATILNQEGKVIESRNYNKYDSYLQQPVDISYLKPGYYIIQIKRKQQINTVSFIKE